MQPNYPNITKVKLPSVQAAEQYADHSLDFVYIDADHAYASVVADINDWKSKVKPGGYIAGHDSYMPEVLKAVMDCLGEPLQYFTDTSWIVKL
jgi:cephalosporin hydroxylase